MSISSDKLLILDLDETLIYATKETLPFREDFQFESYLVYKRPYLERFLVEISLFYKVAIWSSASDEYVEGIVNLIKPELVNFEFVWGRSKCSLRKDHNYDTYLFEKRLDKLKKKGFSLEQILIVDDTPEKSRTNYGNAIHVKEFTGDSSDNELMTLQNYLRKIQQVENVRTIEKRSWRNQ